MMFKFQLLLNYHYLSYTVTTFSMGHLDREIKRILTGCRIGKIGTMLLSPHDTVVQ